MALAPLPRVAGSPRVLPRGAGGASQIDLFCTECSDKNFAWTSMSKQMQRVYCRQCSQRWTLPF